MDNKAYLDEIAVKGKRKISAGPILTPVMIKLIAAAVVAVIAMVIIGAILSDRNSQIAEIHESVYARISSLSDKNGFMKENLPRLHNSQLRSHAVMLQSTLSSTKTDLDTLIKGGALKVDPKHLSDGAKKTNNSEISRLSGVLSNAYLDGHLDTTFASEVYYEIELLISLETQARAKTSDARYAEILDRSMDDLLKLEDTFRDISNS